MKRLCFLILSLSLCGCASTAEHAGDESLGASGRVCVNVRDIRSFDAIDDRTIYVNANGPRKHLLFTMDGGCVGLRSAQTIAVKNTLNSVCSNSSGEVIYRDLDRSLESCRIRNIETVASEDDAEDLVKDRREAKRVKQAKRE